MFKVNTKLLQNYVQDYIHEGDANIGTPYYYEFTVTYAQAFWSLPTAMRSVPQVIADVLKPAIRTIRDDPIRRLQLNYGIEYQENGYPHIHGHLLTMWELTPDIQKNILQRLCRRFGKSQWYQTGQEDKFHEVSGMFWSQYIKKDAEKNSSLGLQHYYEYCVSF